MPKRKAANLIKGLAWLLLAATVLPTFSTSTAPASELTVLTLGLPWSPWLVYRESWTASTSMEVGAPALGYQATLQPRCWSTACFCAGITLVALSRWLRSGQKPPTSRMPTTLGKPTVFGA